MDDDVGFETVCQSVVACYDFADGPSSVHLIVLDYESFSYARDKPVE